MSMPDTPSIVLDALKALDQAGAISTANQCIALSLDESHGFVTLPSDFKTHDLEHLMAARRRARGHMQTHSIDALAQYIEQHHEEGAMVFVDSDAMAATCVLNLCADNYPGHADNLATVTLKRSAAYTALLDANNRIKPQKDAAEWLEDYASFITCLTDVDGELKEIPTKTAVHALRHLKQDASRTVESKVGSLSASTSALDQVAVSSSESIPTFVAFHCTPYLGLPSRSFTVRLGILTGDKPGVVLRIVNPEQHQEEMAQQLADAVRAAVPQNTATVVLGSYKRGA